MWFTAPFLFLLFSCNQDDDTFTPAQSIPQDSTSTHSDTIRFNYLALGDSYTIGTGLPSDTGRYPVLLVNRLNNEGFDGTAPVIIAQNGWTTQNLINSTNNFTPDSAFDLVSLLIGVNNQYQGLDINNYSEQFEFLLKRAITYAGNDTDRVFVLSIPDYSVMPAIVANTETIAAEIDKFNALNHEISSNYGVSYFYITDISRLAANQPELIAPDNLHPSAKMYELWVDLIFEEIKLKLHE